jgi:hypothetical protein
MAKEVNIPGGQYLKGLDTVVENIQAVVDKLAAKSTKGLADALLFVGTESQQRAPVDTGDLRGSLQVTLDGSPIAVGIKGSGITAVTPIPDKAIKGEISYNTKYAARQHEHIEYDHPRGGQAKYLESVLVENSDRILKLMADGMLGDD